MNENTITSLASGVSNTPPIETPEQKTRKFFASLLELIERHPIGVEILSEKYISKASILYDSDGDRRELLKLFLEKAGLDVDEIVDVVVDLYDADDILSSIDGNHRSLIEYVVENSKREIEDYVNSSGEFTVRL